MTQSPKVSIGLPVYNGAAYLADTIDTLLGQTFGDFELIVSDNASTDETEEICRDFAARDGRILFLRQARNVGAARNFNLVFHRARGEYFKWAAHDDRLAPELLARCVDALDRDGGAVLSHTKVRIIDTDGAVAGDYDLSLPNVGSELPHRRFADLILIDHYCYEVFGLIRSDVLRRTPLIGSYIASDRVLLAELGLYGRFVEISERLFFSRDHAERSLRAMPIHFRSAWFDPANRGRTVFPHWRMLSEYLACLRRAPLSPGERARCRLQLLRWPVVNANWARLGADVIAVVAPGAVPAMLRIKDRVLKTEDDPTRLKRTSR